MYDAGEHTIDQIAAAHGVSRPTVYRSLKRTRASQNTTHLHSPSASHPTSRRARRVRPHDSMQLALPTEPLTRSDVLTAAEVASWLRIPTSTVYDLARRGHLPGHRVGRAWRFLRPEIEQWLQAS
jgi:excisionase family DNA binding protein